MDKTEKVRAMISIDGKDITGKPAHKVARLGIGRLFQGRQLMGDLTILENMMVASDNRTGESPFTSVFHPRKIDERERQKRDEAIRIFKDIFGEQSKYLHMLDC